MKRIQCLILIFVFVISLLGCEAKAKKYTDYSFDYFDTVITIIGFEENKETFDKNCAAIKEKFEIYHKLYNVYARYDGINNINTINNSEKAVDVQKELIDLLEFSKEMNTLTDGYVNIAMGSVLSVWHRFREEGLNNPENARIPNMEDLEKLNEHTDINSLVINGNTVEITDKEAKLDVGAIAKGYATEQVALWMEENGITGYLLNAGGNIRIVGKRPDNKKWQIGLENPDTEDTENPYIEYLDLDEMSIVTSGSYQRFYTVDGVSYHHIIDTDTLMPAKGFKMVSVICPDSGMADALSTALFCMDYEQGEKLVNSLKDTYVLWVKEDGEKLYSKGFKNFIK